MTAGKLLSFTNEGQYLAVAGNDGVVRIWNSTSGVLEHEYQPAAHLTATPTCLRYGCKRDSEVLLAIGTQNGMVLLYSSARGDVVGTLRHAPPHSILDISWRSQLVLASLAADNTIAIWDVETGNKKMSVPVSGGHALSYACLRSGIICMGSKQIDFLTFTNKEDYSHKKQFTGHVSSVTQLLRVPTVKGQRRFCVSASASDRFVYAWDPANSSDEPSASFAVKDQVSFVSVSRLKDDTISLAVITVKGVLKLFTKHFNGVPSKKAVKAVGSVQYVKKKKKETVVPILCCTFLNDSEDSIVVAHGQAPFLSFDRLLVKDVEGQEKVIVIQPQSADPSKEVDRTKTLTPKVVKDTVFLGPGQPAPATKKSASKRKREDKDGAAELPMEERLNALAITPATTTPGTRPPKSDNQVHLLLQGLHSKDRIILQTVLEAQEESLINKTVQRLPTPAIVPLLRHLHTLVMGKGYKNCVYVRWVRAVLYHHMGYLSTLPDRAELMGPFYAASAARMDALRHVTQLHARLDLVLTHVATRHQKATQEQVEPDALLMYREESSDEEDLLDTTAVGASESEDNWEELSDFSDDPDNDSDMEVEQVRAGKRSLHQEEGVGKRVTLVNNKSIEEEEEEEEDDDDDDEDDKSDVIVNNESEEEKDGESEDDDDEEEEDDDDDE